MGILLLMADIYNEANHPCSALPYALSAWLHATELGMDLKVPHLMTTLPARTTCCWKVMQSKDAAQGITSNSGQ